MVNFPFIGNMFFTKSRSLHPTDRSVSIVSYSADFPVQSAFKEPVCIRGMLFVWFIRSWAFFIQQLCDDMTGTAGTLYPGALSGSCAFLFGSIVIYSTVEDVVLRCEGEEYICRIIR